MSPKMFTTLVGILVPTSIVKHIHSHTPGVHKHSQQKHTHSSSSVRLETGSVMPMSCSCCCTTAWILKTPLPQQWTLLNDQELNLQGSLGILKLMATADVRSNHKEMCAQKAIVSGACYNHIGQYNLSVTRVLLNHIEYGWRQWFERANSQHNQPLYEKKKKCAYDHWWS